jgi:tetratricopeptide (TPR) repeat protein
MRGRILLAVAILGVSLGLGGSAQENLGRGRVSGTVVDENGAPVDGARVVAEVRAGKTKLEGRTDKSGRFAIAGMGTGAWRVTASKSGYSSSSSDIDIKQLTDNRPLTFNLKKLGGLEAFASDANATTLFDQGNALLGQGKYDDALKIFEEFLARYPEIYQAHLNIGTCNLRKGDLEKAEAEFKIVLDKSAGPSGDYRQDPKAALRAFSGLGEISLRKGDFESARQYFSRALEISPQDEVAAYNVGEIYFSNQKIDEAIRFLELATQIKPGWSKPYQKLGYVYLNKGDFGKSLEAFHKFIELDPQNPEVPEVKNIIATVEKMKR